MPRLLEEHTKARTAALLAILWLTGGVRAATILVQPGDSYTKLEAARAGDQVVITPGVYSFLLHFTARAPATNPIVIRAADPANPPVWDFGTNLLDNAPGSYHAGDRGRAAWQFSGAAGYRVSGITFRNCRNSSLNGAGIRYYSGATNLWIGGCTFSGNDNGLTGGSENSAVTVEFCEFARNGNPGASSPTHNLYIYGGAFTLRYSYLHDSVQAQNFHVRARDALLEYNWIARAASYEGDLMTDDDYANNPVGAFQQQLTLRGNVFVTGGTAANHSQIVALFNDAAPGAPLSLSVRALYNTVVADGGHAAFIHLSNADGTSMTAEISDNIIAGTTLPTLVEDAAAASVQGVHNWLPNDASAGALVSSIRSALPGFNNPAAGDYSLAAGSPCIGVADWTVYGLPGREWAANEAWRPRASARDLGAFESGGAAGAVGVYDTPPAPALTIRSAGSILSLSRPLYAGDFMLEQSPGLPASTWTPADGAVTTNATAVTVRPSVQSGALFFRLRE